MKKLGFCTKVPGRYRDNHRARAFPRSASISCSLQGAFSGYWTLGGRSEVEIPAWWGVGSVDIRPSDPPLPSRRRRWRPAGISGNRPGLRLGHALHARWCASQPRMYSRPRLASRDASARASSVDSPAAQPSRRGPAGRVRAPRRHLCGLAPDCGGPLATRTPPPSHSRSPWEGPR
jgi:hypothetical protein